MQERKFDNFDQFAHDYRDIHTENIRISGADSAYFSELKVKELLRHESAHVDKALKILDMGCGDGAVTQHFSACFTSAEIMGLDISDESIAEALVKNIPRATFRAYNGEVIPENEATFDICFVANVMHHLDKKYHIPLLKELYRVLKPGGRLYIFEHNPWNPVTRKIVKDCIFDKDAVLLPAPHLKKMFQQAGFAKPSGRFILFFPRFPIFNPFLRAEPLLWWIPVGGQYFVKGIK